MLLKPIAQSEQRTGEIIYRWFFVPLLFHVKSTFEYILIFKLVDRKNLNAAFCKLTLDAAFN